MVEEDILSFIAKMKRLWRAGKEILRFYKQLKEVTGNMNTNSANSHDLYEDINANREVVIEGEVLETKRVKHKGKPAVVTEATV